MNRPRDFSCRAAIILAALCFTGVTGDLRAADAPASPISVAVLEPEVATDLPADERKALAAQLDTLLTSALAEQKTFVIVDRQLLDQVLSERTIAAGAGKLTPSEVTEPLRPFWTAGVLICPVVTIAKPEKGSTDHPSTIISIEAVAAQTGQLLAEVQVAGQWQNGRWSEAPQMDEPLKGFWKTLGRNVQASRHQRLVEIPDGRLVSRMTRLQWLVDSLGDSLRAGVASQPGLTLLTPRHPVSTKEERLLRAMGLAAANPEDPAAGLAAAPDVRVRLELTEQIGKDLEYEKTPITIKLTVQANGRAATSESFTGLAAGHEALRAKAESWLAQQLRGQADPAAPVGDEAYCRALAQEELAAANRIQKLCGWHRWNAYEVPDAALRVKAFGRALRAAHLDPTCEEAARLVALGIDAEYTLRGQDRSVACCDRVIEEGQRYLDRFPEAPQSDEVRGNISFIADERLGKIQMQSRVHDLLSVPYDPEVYRYALASLASFEHAVSQPQHSALPWYWHPAEVVYQGVFGHCPPEQLEAVRDHWREFWRKNVEPLAGDVPPWNYVELGYYSRKQDWQAVRNTLTVLAEKYPRSHADIWWGTTLWKKGLPGGTAGQPRWKVRLCRILQEAGDPEWATWEPPFTNNSFIWEPTNYSALLRRLNPHQLHFRPEPDADLALPFDAVDLSWDDPAEARKGFRPLLEAGGFMWLSVPGPNGNLRSNNRLFVLPMAALLKPHEDGRLQPIPIVWPAEASDKAEAPANHIVRCWTTTQEAGATVVWIGTADHGLARFDLQAGGQWQGRWYTAKNGLPLEDVLLVTPCLQQGRPRLLVLGQAKTRIITGVIPIPRPCEPVLWTMDPASGEMALIDINMHRPLTVPAAETPPAYLLSGFAKQPGSVKEVPMTAFEQPSNANLLAVWADGTKLPMRFYNRTDFPELDVGQIVAVAPDLKPRVRPGFHSDELFPATGADGKAQLWQIGPSGILKLDKKMKPVLGQANFALAADNLYYQSPTSSATLCFNAFFLTGHAADWSLPRAPLFILMCGTSEPQTFWGVADTDTGYSGQPRMVAYRPASGSPGEEQDSWYGPWQLPGHATARSMTLLEGRLWVVTSNGQLLRVDPAAAIRAAESAHAVSSTAQWRKKFYARLAAEPWPAAVRVNLTLQNWEAALAAVEAQKQLAFAAAPANLADGGETAVDLALWEALVRARKGDYDSAASLYQQLLDADKVEASAKILALVNLINVQHAAGQWKKVLEGAARLNQLFGGETNTVDKYRDHEQIQWYIKDAQRHLTAEQPASSTAAAAPAATGEKK